MAKYRTRADQTGVADETLLVPTASFFGEMRPNKYGEDPSKRGKSQRRERRTRYVSEFETYDGYEDFLVRTALVRPKTFNPRRGPFISTPESVAGLCRHLADYDQEHFVVIAVSGRMKLRAIFESSKGGSSSTSVEMKHVLKIPLLTGAAGIILVHNHPSGSPQPSNEDFLMFDKAEQGLECIGVSLLDSVIVAEDGYYASSNGYEKMW
jgi:DNA repair protein RadC